MFDSETKSRIDSARDILVGKVPDPKSQVEQITIALIYKFMDDMDRQSEELGGKASFFTGGFKKYRWARLLDKRFGGHERLLLYAEGIEKMNENKNIPQLFRDIFKGVFLPYRDPETLNLFLKEIDGFTYDHSERLGDAFEYLLSVLGTQGDAGQFRTPRHIIDFIVAVVDPQKHETILDPACGTAGFLISAFKHILKGKENLTPDERARLMTNFRGYDIAPDMVRLSRANLYLHGFVNPVIHEYDTLTSEERWDERCDVILANPPFMTPKGGIRPHNRFSIKAKRSEVLFVDYMAEHLAPGGRAGVIVPEGIIFQSQNAYKALRKMLIENYLWAVVSLPAGVFNPYSGVKTSILFLDRNLARRTDEVLFVKVENDGFDLGAQRRPNGKNDLPEAVKILDDYKKAPTFANLSACDAQAEASAGRQETQEGKMALAVSRKRLLDSGDVNLSGDRYRKAIAVQSKWPMVKLGEVCELITEAVGPNGNGSGSYLGLDAIESNTGRLMEGVQGESAKSTKWAFVKGDILYGKLRPNLNKVWLADRQGICSTDILVLRCHVHNAMAAFMAPVLLSPRFNREVLKGLTGAQLPRVRPSHLLSISVPLPPLDVQQQIVGELEGYRKIIEGARQVIANYKPTIKIDPKWPKVKLGEVAEVIAGQSPEGKYYNEIGNGTPFYQGKTEFGEMYIGEPKIWTTQIIKLAEPDDILMSVRAPVGPVNLTMQGICIGRGLTAIREKKIHQMFLFYNLKSMQDKIKGSGGAVFDSISKAQIEEIEIPLPPLDAQREIVAEIEAEQSLVDANRKLVEIFEKKIQAKLAEIWGEE